MRCEKVLFVEFVRIGLKFSRPSLRRSHVSRYVLFGMRAKTRAPESVILEDFESTACACIAHFLRRFLPNTRDSRTFLGTYEEEGVEGFP